jgi:hypothetical protein
MPVFTTAEFTTAAFTTAAFTTAASTTGGVHIGGVHHGRVRSRSFDIVAVHQRRVHHCSSAIVAIGMAEWELGGTGAWRNGSWRNRTLAVVGVPPPQRRRAKRSERGRRDRASRMHAVPRLRVAKHGPDPASRRRSGATPQATGERAQRASGRSTECSGSPGRTSETRSRAGAVFRSACRGTACSRRAGARPAAL